METDYYKLLEISPDANEKTIRKAWRIKTKSVHPDINKSDNANAQFRELTLALETLLDTASRIKHDRHFGYYDKPKTKHTNAKQNFSEYQKTQAEKNVKEWSNDYNVAMAIREEQRKKYISKHKKNIRALTIALFILFMILILALSIIFRIELFSGFPSFD